MLKVQIVQWIVSHAYNRDWFFLFFIRFLPLWVRKPYEKRKSKFPRILDPLAAGNAHVPIGPAIRPDLRSTLPRLSLSLILSSDSKNAVRCALILIYSVQDTLSFPCPSLFPVTALPSSLRKGYNVMGL